MNLNKASGERARAMELAGASLGFSRETFEQSAAKGIYHAIFEGYKEKHKDEYLALHPKLLAMRAKRDQLLRWTPAMAKGLIAKFLKELEDFEAFMKSMTEVKREAWAPNVITDVGVHQLLDAGLAGSAYTVTGPFMGLIGAVSYSGVPVAANTMASHATWTEAGVTNAPTYTGPRKTIAWSAASGRAKAPSSAPVFAMTATPGTVKGVFIVFGSGAVSTIDSTAGTLYSAGLFSGGDQAVVNTNTVTVTYSTSLT